MMDKKEELEKAVLDICVCGEIMIGVGKRLAAVFGVDLPDDGKNQAHATVETAKNEKATPAPTLEEIRAVLAQKSVEGLTDKVKELIASYGVKRLSDVPSEKYAELLQKAEVLGNGG